MLTTLNTQCDAEKTKCTLKSGAKNKQIMDSYLNLKSFAQQSGYLILAPKG